jgi:hypothetical protein
MIRKKGGVNIVRNENQLSITLKGGKILWK